MPDELQKKNRVGMAGFAARAANVQKSEVVDSIVIADNRIVLLLDDSGSMQDYDRNGRQPKSKIDLLKDAVTGFVNSCDFGNTAVALYSIPVGNNTVRLTQQGAMIILAALGLTAQGGTPMGSTMANALDHEPITRAVLISDGQPTDDPFPSAAQYKKAGIPIDCVHIGDGGGEECLQRIAEMTGGKFLKFTNVTSFAGALKYLTPALRGLLNSPEAAKLIGADTIK